jgi:DNA polymerase III delta subunit
LQPQANFYQRAKKELILLDMGGEKPWEKKKRLKEWLVEQAAKEKKALPDEVALFLLDQVGSEKSALEQELFKLITFVGDKKTVSLADALAITSKTQTLTNWKFAELLVWEEKNQAFPNIEDTSDLLGLIASLRAQFEQGLKAVSSGEVDQEIPSWKKEQLDKQRTLAQKRGADFFAKALVLLFEIELEAKNSLFSPKLLADFLLCKITALKYGTSTSSKLAS